MPDTKPSKPIEICRPISVQTYDIDFAGIVSNISYIRWLEDMRLQVLDEYLPLTEQLKEGYGPILMETHIEYKKPLKIGDKPIGIMHAEGNDDLRWTLVAEFFLDGVVHAKARQSGVFINFKTRRPIPMPEVFKVK
jgi:acyl-CoA thioester hydrolase